MNRLGRQTSPYLLQHAHNPVDWFPWGQEAFEHARATERPIFLSIGYAACHWCHVMERESFENEALAAQLNAGFVCVKVDREEHPDVDELYQRSARLLGRGGGWPLTVFLTPDLEPFFAGTYFPPDDRLGMPGLPRVLEAVARAWREDRDDVVETAAQLRETLEEVAGEDLGDGGVPFTEEDLRRAGRGLARLVDPIHGGFGGAPKFPHPGELTALLRAWRRGGGEDLRDGVRLTLERMATGGIYDQLGGGFHRYAVDRAWAIPHFEKMLYDNAQLISLYTEAWLVDGGERNARIVAETVAWLERRLLSPRGGFYASEDADSEGAEGRHYVFRRDALDAIVGAERAALLAEHLGIDEEGNFEDGFSVPSLAVDAAQLALRHGLDESAVRSQLQAGRRALFLARERRPRPSRDEKILAGWNGLAIGALAQAARAFNRPEWAARAAAAADDVLARMVDGDALRRSSGGIGTPLEGLLEDYGDFVEGLVELSMATFEPRYLEAAARLAEGALRRFWSGSERAFFANPVGSRLIAPLYAGADDAWPSGASTLTRALVRLAALTSDPRWLAVPEAWLDRMHGAALAQPLGFGRLLLAADAWIEGAATLVVAGSGERAASLIAELNRRYLPEWALAWADPSREPPALLRPTLEGKAPVDGEPAVYPCRRFRCERPWAAARALEALGVSGAPESADRPL